MFIHLSIVYVHSYIYYISLRLLEASSARWQDFTEKGRRGVQKISVEWEGRLLFGYRYPRSQSN